MIKLFEYTEKNITVIYQCEKKADLYRDSGWNPINPKEFEMLARRTAYHLRDGYIGKRKKHVEIETFTPFSVKRLKAYIKNEDMWIEQEYRKRGKAENIPEQLFSGVLK